MNRIELYIDRNDRLTIDFYYKYESEFPMSRSKGKECYSIISDLCTGDLIEVKEDEKNDELILLYKETIIRVNEYSKTLSKRGTGPLKKELYKYYEAQELKNKKLPKNPKVTRKNKYVAKEIIAGALVLSVLGGIVAHEIFNSKKDKEVPSNDITPTTSSQEGVYEVVNYEALKKNEVVSTEMLKNIGFNAEYLDYIKQSEDEKINIFLDYNDRSDTEKAHITREYYGAAIEKYAKTYGLDPQIVIAIATQERGIHSGTKDPGGATGLMQIQNIVWAGKKLTAYNQDTQSYESIIVDEAKLSDVFYNIKVGCMYFQNCMDYMKGNLLAAVQCYNMGYGNMNRILNEYSVDTNRSVEQILNDISDYGWLEYRDLIKVGDQKYIEHVFSWIADEFELNDVKINNQSVDLRIGNKIDKKSISYN